MLDIGCYGYYAVYMTSDEDRVMRVRLSDEDWRELRVLAAEQGRSVRATISAILEKALQKEKA